MQRLLGYLVVVREGRQVNVQITDENRKKSVGELVVVAERVIKKMKRRGEQGEFIAAPADRVLV